MILFIKILHIQTHVLTRAFTQMNIQIIYVLKMCMHIGQHLSTKRAYAGYGHVYICIHIYIYIIYIYIYIYIFSMAHSVLVYICEFALMSLTETCMVHGKAYIYPKLTSFNSKLISPGWVYIMVDHILTIKVATGQTNRIEGHAVVTFYSTYI